MAENKTDIDIPTMAAERERMAIDRGHTGDKIPYGDPAAAPLGTDDEAGGHRQKSAPPPPGNARAPAGHEKGRDLPTGTKIGVMVVACVGVVAVVAAIAAIAAIAA